MKKFRIKLIYKIFLLIIVIGAGIYGYFYLHSLLPLFLCALILGFQVYDIIKYIELTNKMLARFITSIQYSDFSQSFGAKRIGAGFDDLTNSLNTVMDEFRKTRNEKEEQYRFLQTVIRHIGIGLLCFDNSGKIEFINKMTLKLLGIKQDNLLTIHQLPNELRQKITNITPGEKAPIKIYTDTDIINLIVYSTEFKMRNQIYKLVSFQNIQIELEEKELEAWQKLIRVLTHEIMNSVTPISSLASTVNMLLDNSDEDVFIDEKKIGNIKNAIKTIEKRSEGLINFVDNYRNLTKIPKPNFEIVSVKLLFTRLQKLLKNDIDKSDINLEIFIEPDTLEVTADPSLVEQVIINLILNSIHALENCKERNIKLSGELTDYGKINIKVSDNGPGIAEEIQEKIFIPFFSTKKDGSGIGLSLARQIMRLHGGNIRVDSKPYSATEFTLIF